MKKIAIVSVGYMWFPCEKGYGRMFDVACAFSEADYKVDVIVPDFQHHNKAYRDKAFILNQGYPMNILFAHAPAYSKNVSIGRIKSNRDLSKNVENLLDERIGDYDIVLCSIPANDVAAKVVKLCNLRGVPCVVDVEDLWPEAMSMVIKNETLRNMLLSRFKRDAERAYAGCNGVTGTSDDYTMRAFKNQNRDIPHVTSHVGVDIEAFDTNVSQNISEIQKPSGEFWVTYAGSISTSYDIETIVSAGELLKKEGKENIRIHILGTGSNYEMLKNISLEKGLDNVTFHGFVKYPKMCAFLKKSDILINSFIKGAPQSIVNKVGDYFAAGKAVINTLENPVFCKIVEDNNLGVNIPPENAGLLRDAICLLYNDPEGTINLGLNARGFCEKRFDRKTEVKRIIQLADSLLEGRA